MRDDYDFLCGNDFTWVKIALGNDDYHTIRVQADLAKTIDFSGGLRALDEIIIDRCNKFTQILWPENARSVKRLKIGNCAILDSLDLSVLINLEELSIVNCKKLTNINGLGEHLHSINIQGSKLDTLDVSRCPKIKNFILTTYHADFEIELRNCERLQSAIINVEGGVNFDQDSIYRERSDAVVCVFDNCLHLDTLAIKSQSVTANIDISACPSLQSTVFVLADDSIITGYSSAMPADAENIAAEIENHSIQNKKNALKMPKNSDDIETTIQQNGASGNKSGLVKLQLLLRPGKHNYISRYEMHADKNLQPNSKPLNQAIDYAYKKKSPFPILETRWHDYLEYPVKNGLPSLSKADFMVMSLQPVVVDNPNDNYLSVQEKHKEFANVFFKYVNQFYKHQVTKNDRYKDYPRNKTASDLLKKNVDNKGLYNIGSQTLAPVAHFMPRSLFVSGSKSRDAYPCKISEKWGQPNNFTGGKPLPNVSTTSYSVPAAYMNEKNNAPALEIAEESVSQDSQAIKQRPQATYLKNEPALADYENENNYVLKIKVGDVLKENLIAAKRESASQEPLIAAPQLAAYDSEDSFLDAYDITEKLVPQEHGTEIDFKCHVMRALVDLKPLDDNFNRDDADFFLQELNERIVLGIKKIVSTQDLRAAEKQITTSEYVTAMPQLVNYETENSFLLACEIRHVLAEQDSEANAGIDFHYHVARALVELKPREDSFSDDFLNSCLDELNQKIINSMQNQPVSDANVIGAEKIIANAGPLKVEPVLAPYVAEEHFLLAVEINEAIHFEVEAIVNQAWMMDDMSGRDLSAISADDYAGVDMLSTLERIDLTYALLLALKEQIRDHGLVHRDIKPENILVDLGPAITVKIIDDFSMEIPDGQLLGTEGYYAPEMVAAPMSACEKADVYSMGRVIALIWRVDLATYIANNEHPYAPDCYTCDDLLDGLFYEIDGLSDADRIDIENMLIGMLHMEPESRYSVDEALDAFACVGAGEMVFDDSLAEIDFIESQHSMEDEFDTFRELLVSCELVDDDNGTLFTFFLEKMTSMQHEMDYAIDMSDMQATANDDWLLDTDIFSDDSQNPDKVMSDDMLDFLNDLTDEERELLALSGDELSSDSPFFDTLRRICSKPDIGINLKAIAPEHVAQLLRFFDSQSEHGMTSWEKDRLYTFDDGSEFTFRNDVFQRARKDGHEGLRYEAISNKAPIGQGGFGTVRRIKGTVVLDAEDERIQFKKHGKDGKRRVVKVQEHTAWENSLADYQKAFEFSKRAPHLAIKEPAIVDTSLVRQTSYTVMDEIPGRDLFAISADDYAGVDVLSTLERIDLTYALLLALKEQVRDQGLVHRDIKPENILVDLGPPITVKIIDYDFSMDTPDGQSLGTEGYYAPEIVSAPMSTCEKADVYSMGRVIALIWRVDVATYIENEDYPYAPNRYTFDDLLAGLFHELDDLHDADRIDIENMLIGMLHTDPESRFSVDEALDAFTYVGADEVIYSNMHATGGISESSGIDNFRFFHTLSHNNAGQALPTDRTLSSLSVKRSNEK